MRTLAHRKICLILGLILVLGIAVTACGPAAGEEEETTLNIGEGEITAIDPHKQRDMRTGRTLAHAFESLAQWSEEGELIPWLAESWDVEDNGSTFIFHLRTDVKFHDGTQFDAEAAKFSLERVLDPDTASPSAGQLGAIDTINVLDEYTLEVLLNAPNFLFVHEVTVAATGMVSPTAVQELGEAFGDKPVGTGPFMLVSHEPGSRLVLEAFDDYWGGRPKIDEVVIRIIPEEDSQEIELEAGNLHIANYLTADGASRLDAQDGYTLIGRPGTNQRMYAFNNEEAPMDDVRVRQAISYAIDREALLDEAFLGMGIPATTGVLPHSWSHNDDVRPTVYDLSSAEALLDEAGWTMTADGVREKDGEKLHLTIFTGSERERVRASEVLQAFLLEVGISSEIQSFEWGTYLDHMREGGYHLSFWTMNFASPDPNAHYNQFNSAHHWNVMNYRDPRMDALLDAGRATTDEQERKDIYDEIQEILIDEAVVAWLFHYHHPLVARDTVQDLFAVPSGYAYLLHNARLAR